jgi:hypothetical protein
MLAASICAVAVIGGSVTLALLKDSGSFDPKSSKLETAAQSLQEPSDTQLRAAMPNGPINAPAVTSASAPVVMLQDKSSSQLTIVGQPPSLTKPLTPGEIADLVKRGRELITAGRIRDARLLLNSAADAGDPTAAFALATTYDPLELEKLGARDADPDVAMAEAWYQKANDLGSTAAEGIPLPRPKPQHR